MSVRGSPGSVTDSQANTRTAKRAGLSKIRQPSSSKLTTPNRSPKGSTKTPNKPQNGSKSAANPSQNGSKTPANPSQNGTKTSPNLSTNGNRTPTPGVTPTGRPARTSGIKAPVGMRPPSSAKGDENQPAIPPRRSIETAKPAKPKRTSGKSPASRTNSATSTESGPVAPPRTGAGIKRSVTARQSSTKSLAAEAAKTKVCKHPSLEMQRSVSSESTESTTSRGSRGRTPTGRPAKTRQPTSSGGSTAPSRGATTNQTKSRGLKRPSTRPRPTELEISKENRKVKYSENTNVSKSQSKDSVGSKSSKTKEPTTEPPKDRNRTITNADIISPSEFLLNQSLSEKLAANQSNRHGFILTDTDASVVSCGSTEFNSSSGNEGKSRKSSVILTSDDFRLNKEYESSKSMSLESNKPFLSCYDSSKSMSMDSSVTNVSRYDKSLSLESGVSQPYSLLSLESGVSQPYSLLSLESGVSAPYSILSSSDLVTSSDTDRDDYDEVAGESTDQDRRVGAPLDDIVSQIAAAGALNDLSDPNRSPNKALNITPDEYAGRSEDVKTPSNGPALRVPPQKTISAEAWNEQLCGKVYHSPDDNFGGAKGGGDGKDLYYDSSDLNLDPSSGEEAEKKINTVRAATPVTVRYVDQNMSQSFQEKAVSKEVDIDIKLSENGDVISSNYREPVTNDIAMKLEDLMTPMAPNTPDPLGMIGFEEVSGPVRVILTSPDPDLGEVSSAPATAPLPRKFPENLPPTFSRNQRSIRPSRRKQLVRSTSLDKKYLTQRSAELYSDSVESLEGEEEGLYVVETMIGGSSPATILEKGYLSPTTPDILVSSDQMRECLETLDATSPNSYYPGKKRFILRSKHRERNTDVTRRFSETQVFKHHKEKYMKRREIEEKYSSCPVPPSATLPPTPDRVTDSPKYIRGFVKRVSSMLTPTNRPKVLLRKSRDSFGSSQSVYMSFDSSGSFSEARSLHDEFGDSTSVGTTDKLHRSNSLELDDHSATVRRTLSDREKHETEAMEHPGLIHKAKSISEQLERIKYSLNCHEGVPNLPFKDWTELVPESTVQNLSKKETDQQHHIWELVTTEHNYITILSTIINVLLGALKELHTEGFLLKIQESDTFLNIEKIRDIHLVFWEECVEPLIQAARDSGEPLNPEVLTGASSLFEEEFNPHTEYCIKYIESRSYIKSQQHKNNDFKEYINWCNVQIGAHHNRLSIDDMLVKPIQRIQKYPIIIRDILKKTTDDDVRTALTSFHEKVRVFVETLNRRKEEKEEQQKIESVQDRIESYTVLPTSSSNTNDQINKVLAQYNRFDLAKKVPLLNTQRKFIHETSCKLSSINDSKAHDVTMFLFSDHLLITRGVKSSKKKFRIIKQPLTLDRVQIEELEGSTNTNLIVYLNEYGSLVDVFLLQSTSSESHHQLYNAVYQAKDNYQRERNKFFTELDSSKSVTSSTSSNYLSTSPAIPRSHLPCSITRTSSEHYPVPRRALADSGVARAQSMPASNEKRSALLPAPMSSASSSACSSSSSVAVSEASGSSSATERSPALSDIKESDKSAESAEEQESGGGGGGVTIEQRAASKNSLDSISKNFDDVYISDNLSTEFKGKLDMNKNICDSVTISSTPTNEVSLSKSDAIYIEHNQSDT